MSDQRKKRQNASSRNRQGSTESLHSQSQNMQRNLQTSNSNAGRFGRNSNSHNIHKGTGYHRQGSYDRVRKIVQEEGRAARNLLSWNVPVVQEGSGDEQLSFIINGVENLPKAPRSPKIGRLVSVKSSHQQVLKDRSRTRSTGRDGQSVRRKGDSHSRPSSQQGRGTKKDLRARYWAFLFDNLKRAVDEIYQTCEADESVVECKEVIMMLDQCSKDFRSLIERMNLIEAYEKAEEGKRPKSLAWEVRKSSPGKSLNSSGGKEHFVPSPTVARSLNFSTGCQPAKVASSGSWADKVRGTVSSSASGSVPHTGQTRSVTESSKTPTTNTKAVHNSQQQEFEEEGWETVQRGRARNRTQNSAKKTSGVLVPQSKTKQNNKNSNGRKANTDSKKKPAPAPATSPYSDAVLTPDHEDKTLLAIDILASHTRTNSGDSEKENFLPNCVKKREVKQNSESFTAGEEKTIISIPSPDSIAEAVAACTVLPLEKLEQNLNDQEQEGLNITDSKGDVEMRDNFDEDEVDVTSHEEPDEDELAIQLENALVSVLDEQDELSNALEEEQQAALQCAIEQEQCYLKEIEQEERMEMVLMVSTDDDGSQAEEEDEKTETDQQTTNDLDSSLPENLDWDAMVKEFDEKLKSGEEKSWGEQAEDADVIRTPGRVVHMHEKLSSPSRKRSPTEARQRAEFKQAKAQELREKLLNDKSDRLRTLANKVAEARAYKDEIVNQKKDTMEKRLTRAEEKRQLQLKLKVRKAHEEETKANEIAFINTLEAQNKRHDIILKHQESEARLHDLQEERLRKQEEKAAKETAVEERRKALEAERLARLQEMQERRRQRETEFEQRQQERDKERMEAARVKERGREERIATAKAQQRTHIAELQKKIQHKQDETERRHKERLEQVREKAFEMSVLKHSTDDHNEAPRLVPYESNKFCTACKILITSEVSLLSHLMGKRHHASLKESNGGMELIKQDIETFNLKHICDAPAERSESQITCDRERLKALKKRSKKLRQRMSQRGTEYENSLSNKQQTTESEHRAKLHKIIRDLNKHLQTQDKGPWQQNKVANLDRALGELIRILDKNSKQVVADRLVFRHAGGVTSLCRLLMVLSQSTTQLPPVIPAKTLVHACGVLSAACRDSPENCQYLLYSNKLGFLLDLLAHQLSLFIPDNANVVLNSGVNGSVLRPPFDAVANALLTLLSVVLDGLASQDHTSPVGLTASVSVSSSTSSLADHSHMDKLTVESFVSRCNDIISYTISVGVVDKLSRYFTNIRGSIDGEPQVADLLQNALSLLTAMVKMLSKRNTNIFEEKRTDDATQLVQTIRVTQLAGIVSLLYSILLHSGAPSRGDNIPPALPDHTVRVVERAFRMLNHLALLDLKLLQCSLGEEGTSLELRHIASYLVWYCGHHSQDSLLHELILCVGYFTVLNHDNQGLIQSGQPPTVLQQLCSLPFQYFSDPKLTGVLFPTLIASCHGSERNRHILEQELSCALLANFLEEKQLEAQSQQMTTGSSTVSSPPERESGDDRLLLDSRFPPSDWQAAQDYFNRKAS